MDTTPMRHDLYTEYQAITKDWVSLLDEAQQTITALTDARRQLAELKDNLELHQTSIILAETGKEGRINGPNEQTRKMQTTILLANLPREDPDYATLFNQFQSAQRHVEDLQARLDIIEKKLSFLRNQARMIAGLAHSLAG